MAKQMRRDPQRETRWRETIERQARSGLSVRAFCRRSGISEAAFYYWRRELRRRTRQEQQAAEEPAQPAFVRVRITGSGGGPAGAIEIVLGDPCRLVVRGPVDRQALADVLAVVSNGPEPAGRLACRQAGTASAADGEGRPC